MHSWDNVAMARQLNDGRFQPNVALNAPVIYNNLTLDGISCNRAVQYVTEQDNLDRIAMEL